jgi:hypothetical protein
MKIYDVYFEVYGKKMKAAIPAWNQKQVEFILFSKIIFHKVEPSKEEGNNEFNKVTEEFLTAVGQIIPDPRYNELLAELERLKKIVEQAPDGTLYKKQ